MGKSEYQKLIDLKKKAKEQLFKECWPKASTATPLVMVFAPDKESDILFQVLEGCLVLPCRVIVVSAEEPEDHVKHPSGKITWINPEDGRNIPKIERYLLAADMAVTFEEHLKDLEMMMKKGVVVIGHEKSPLLENYHPNEETGNSFTYSSVNPWDIFSALVRANETHRFPYDWQNIIRGIVKTSL